MGFQCASDIALGPVARLHQKGLVLDDQSFVHCPFKVPRVWPNTQDPVTSVRLFKAWHPTWGGTGSERGLRSRMEAAWSHLLEFADSNNAKYWVGTQLSCNREDDDRDWRWLQDFLQLLGPSRVMGLSVGNELELLYQKQGVSDECVQRLWSGGYVWEQFTKRVREFDAMGFSHIPVTSVFGGFAFSGDPFVESPKQALLASFLRNSISLYGHRFVFAFNFYPYFDPNLHMDPGGDNSCRAALQHGLCFGASCDLPLSLKRLRSRLVQVGGSPNHTIWLGETGWSTPVSSTLNTDMVNCPEWSSMESFQAYYENFLNWDLHVGEGVAPADHVFYFSPRDSDNFGFSEHFGLVDSCRTAGCKIRSPGYTVPFRPSENGHRLAYVGEALFVCAFATLAGLLAIVVCQMVRRCHHSERGCRTSTNDSAGTGS
mmetsp:Transcript_68254/g.177160  ORF Transcript_68254/g.177160 Transcript_68254/m.177160 type:complete len:429 (-) Transcript_68254:49-1335(-)